LNNVAARNDAVFRVSRWTLTACAGGFILVVRRDVARHYLTTTSSPHVTVANDATRHRRAHAAYSAPLLPRNARPQQRVLYTRARYSRDNACATVTRDDKRVA